MIWIPITLAAAALQTARNAFQRGLTGALSPLGATYTRFAFGFPFAALYAACVFARAVYRSRHSVLRLGDTRRRRPDPRHRIADAAVPPAQLLDRDRVLEVRDPPGGAHRHRRARRRRVALAALAIGVATVGLVLLSRDPARRAGAMSPRACSGGLRCSGWPPAPDRGRGGRLPRRVALARRSVVLASAAATVAAATLIQSVLMTVYLRWREPGQIGVVLRLWRRSLLPGLFGAAASACWFTAMTIEIAAYVRMLGSSKSCSATASRSSRCASARRHRGLGHGAARARDRGAAVGPGGMDRCAFAGGLHRHAR